MEAIWHGHGVERWFRWLGLGQKVLRVAVVATTLSSVTGTTVARAERVEWVILERPATTELEFTGLLGRELLRQAVLVTAREAFSLRTLDAVLDEPRPEASAAGLTLRVETAFTPGRIALTLFHGRAAEPVVELEAAVDSLPGFWAYDHRLKLATVEHWTRHELVEAFERLGLQRRPRGLDAADEDLAGVDEHLHDLRALAQYHAVREAHRLIRDSGESPQRLAALSRAYANLGQLVRYHFNASEQVFYARSLLYAQRLVARGADEPAALWARAYAYALSGLDYAALADLDRAGEIAGELDEPGWVPIVADYLHERVDALEAAAAGDSPEAAMAAYLRFMIAERSYREITTVKMGEQVLERWPHQLRVVAAMTKLGGVRSLHRTTLLGPAILMTTVPPAVEPLDDLPDVIHHAARRLEAEPWPSPTVAELVEALVAQSRMEQTVHEPSVALLGRLIEETHFFHVYTRAHFKRLRWGVETETFVDRARASVGNHRYAPFIEALRWDPYRHPDQVNQQVATVDFADMSLSMATLFGRRWWSRPDRTPLWRAVLAAADFSVHDLAFERALYPDDEDWLRARAVRLRGISPNAAVGVATQIQVDFEAIEPELPELVQRYGEDATVLEALIDHHLAHGQAEHAKRLLERLIVITQDAPHYMQLAEIHLERGDEDQWRAVLDRYLREGEDAGLSKVDVAMKLATHYLHTARPEQALPYAGAAAQSQAGDAMILAVHVHEAMGDFEQAEKWIRQAAERYEQMRIEWVLWCHRTGKGDVEPAAAFYRALIEQQPDDVIGLSSAVRQERAIFHMLEGEDEAALELFHADLERSHDAWSGTHAVILAHRLGRRALCEQLLTRLGNMNEQAFGQQPDRPVIAASVRQLTPHLQNELADSPDLAAIDEQIAALPVDRQVNVKYLLAMLLELAGHEKLALEYLQRCDTGHNLMLFNHVLAQKALRERALKP